MVGSLRKKLSNALFIRKEIKLLHQGGKSCIRLRDSCDSKSAPSFFESAEDLLDEVK
jgi:hypothetical protein